jgi:PAS domain S-box-containing protein
MVSGATFSLGSVRGRSILAGLALLLLLAGVAGVALWRAQSEGSARRSLEKTAFAVAALESAHAQIFLTATFAAISVFADDPQPFVDQYQQGRAAATESLQGARDKLAAAGEPDDAAALDEVAGEAEKLFQDADRIMASFLTTDRDTRVEMGLQYLQQLWPEASTAIVNLEQVAQEQEAKLSAERATADRTSQTTLALFITFSAFAFLTAAMALFTLIRSVARPLAELRASARAVTSGDLDARAKVSGPEEVASLARDFNEMTEAMLDRTTRLQQSEQKFRDVLEVSRDLIYKLNLETRTYDYVSPSAVQLLGFTPQEITAMGVREVRMRFHPDDRKRFGSFPSDPPGSTAEDRMAPVVEYRWLRKDGEYRWLSDDRAFVRDENGKVLAVVGTVRDVTNRKAAEDALRESEQKFRGLSASAPVGIYSADLQGRFTYVNEHLLDTLGLGPEEVLGRNWARNLHPDDRQATVGEVLKAASEMRALSREYRIVRPGGEVRWLRTAASMILSRDGSPLSYVGAVEDITERKQIEEDKQTAFENTVMLLAVAAEARDPYTENHLLRIRGYSEAIASELGLSPREAREIGLASLLHDIGKIRVPDSILTKPGPLTAEEWGIIKQHPIWGEDLLPLHPSFESARQIARWHHENWDGTGYPDGLRGEEIPIGAAVTAVADGFDAMTTERPYKGAWPPGRAIREIRQNKGLRYSPKVVEAFERALRQGEIKKVATTSPPSISDLVKAA